ncbi:MAG: molybdenum cofactor guanylyltransferase, partial [Gemmatimonadota bacterium]
MSDRGLHGVLGVVLAGGASRRYGAPKALATVAGERIADRAIRAVREAVGRVVVVANDAPTFGVLGLPMRPDARPGAGALGGMHTAVAWAEEEGFAGALVVACDMPFLSTALLEELCRLAPPDEAVVPASDSKRGL